MSNLKGSVQSFKEQVKEAQERGAPDDPYFNFFIYGGTGTGKTTNIKTLKEDCQEHDAKAIILNVDKGDKSIRSALDEDWLVDIPIEDWEDLKDAYAGLSTTDHPFRWIVLDDVTVMAGYLLDLLKDKHGDDTWSAFGELNTRFRDMLEGFRNLESNLYFIAREAKMTVDGYEKACPRFPGKALGADDDGEGSVAYEFDFVFRQKAKLDGDERKHYLICQETESTIAKKRDEHHVLNEIERPDLTQLRKKLVEGRKDVE